VSFYLAGPMSGIPEHNFPAFRAAAADLRDQGYRVISPVELDEEDGFDGGEVPSGSSRWAEFLARDVKIVASENVEALVLLPGWEKSRGAALEIHVARELGKKILSYPTLDPLPERHPSSARFHAILASHGGLHDRKQADYGRGDDPFANVRASEDFGVAGWIGTVIRANDKMKRIQTAAAQYLTTGKVHLANEGLIDAFDDLAVYAVIARVLFEEGTLSTSG
jgi:hypothetical protein